MTLDPRAGGGLPATGPASPDAPAESLPDLMTRYSGLYAPVDGVFRQVASMAALVFDAQIVAVNVAEDARVWFPPPEGPHDGGTLPPGPGLSTTLAADLAGARGVPDTARDQRTRDHPWVRGANPIRFIATAPVVSPLGQRIGSLDVMDRRRRRSVTPHQLELLTALAAVVAQLLDLRLGALATLRDERASHTAEIATRDAGERLTAQASQARTTENDRRRSDLCQLGRDQPCAEPAELKVADSWGQGAWGCWAHAEDALMHIPSVFLATESVPNLSTYRSTSPD